MALLFYLLPRRAGLVGAAVASYYFYARWNAWYVVFLWILTASDFAIGLWVDRARETGRRDSRLLLAAGIAANLAFLGTFKYLNFASTTVAALVGMHQNPWLVSLFVPIGISFHTFQSISYLVDVYRGRTPAIRKPFDYALYLAFFPQLLAGPIVRAGLFFGEFSDLARPGSRRHNLRARPRRLRSTEEDRGRRSVCRRRQRLLRVGRRASGGARGLERALRV